MITLHNFDEKRAIAPEWRYHYHDKDLFLRSRLQNAKTFSIRIIIFTPIDFLERTTSITYIESPTYSIKQGTLVSDKEEKAFVHYCLDEQHDSPYNYYDPKRDRIEDEEGHVTFTQAVYRLPIFGISSKSSMDKLLSDLKIPDMGRTQILLRDKPTFRCIESLGINTFLANTYTQTVREINRAWEAFSVPEARIETKYPDFMLHHVMFNVERNDNGDLYIANEFEFGKPFWKYSSYDMLMTETEKFQIQLAKEESLCEDDIDAGYYIVIPSVYIDDAVKFNPSIEFEALSKLIHNVLLKFSGRQFYQTKIFLNRMYIGHFQFNDPMGFFSTIFMSTYASAISKNFTIEEQDDAEAI